MTPDANDAARLDQEAYSSAQEKDAEVAALKLRIAALETWGVPDYPRICLNCGKTWPADVPRTAANCEPPADLPEDLQELVPCTADFTYMELIEEMKKNHRQITALNRALADLRKEKA